MDTRDRLLALHAEARRQHIHFETLKRRRETVSKAINVAIVLGAVASAAASGAELPTPATITFAGALMIAVTLNLYLNNTQRDRDLHILSDRWLRHQADAAPLLHAMQNSGEERQLASEDAVALEHEMVETRTESLLCQPLPGAAEGDRDAR